MSKQSKAAERRILEPIRMILISLLAVFIPLTGYTEDVNQDMIKTASRGDIAAVMAFLLNTEGAPCKGKLCPRGNASSNTGWLPLHCSSLPVGQGVETVSRE